MRCASSAASRSGWESPHDDMAALREKLQHALEVADIVLLSGGTSKGAGDLSYRVVAELRDPGHRRARRRAQARQADLPGGDSRPAGGRASRLSDIGDLHVSRVRRAGAFELLAGRGLHEADTVSGATGRQGQQRDRPDGVPAGGFGRDGGYRSREGSVSLAAYPMGQGSGSVTTFSRADGFATIGRHEEIVQAGTLVDVQLLGRELQLADLVVIGSHCIGLDYLLGELQQQGVRSKFLAVGSTAGLDAAKRGECDVAGIHLLDPKTDEYNRPFLTRRWIWSPVTAASQGVVFRQGDVRFEGRTAQRSDRRRQNAIRRA